MTTQGPRVDSPFDMPRFDQGPRHCGRTVAILGRLSRYLIQRRQVALKILWAMFPSVRTVR
jgi:hypothetical protein